MCFAFNADAAAACQGDDFGQNPDDVVTTPRGNFTGLYPPLFYLTMSAFAGADIEASVLSMRIANSVLFVGLVSALFALLPPHRRTTLVWSVALSVVPLGMFLIPSTNPSGWAILSAGTLWLSLLGAFETTGRRRIGLGGIALLATVIGAGARADAALYAGLAIVIVLLLTFRKSRAWLFSSIFALALLVIAGLFYLSASQGAAAAQGLSEAGGPDVNPLVLALANVINVPSLWVGVFGSWNLGWLDTVLPSGVWVAGFASFCGAIFIGLAARVPRKGIAIAVVVLVLWALPTYLLVQSQSIVGANFQPRYLLPLMVLLAGLLLLHDRDTPLRTTAVQRWVVVIALSLANALALHTNIRRYVTGADVPSVNLNEGIEWWWQLPVSPMVVWGVGSLTFAGVLVLINTRTWNLPKASVSP